MAVIDACDVSVAEDALGIEVAEAGAGQVVEERCAVGVGRSSRQQPDRSHRHHYPEPHQLAFRPRMWHESTDESGSLSHD